MTASRTIRLSAAAVVLAVTALALGTRTAEAGAVVGHVSGQVSCNTVNGNQVIAWNYSSNGQAGTIDSATMSGATTGAVTMTPTVLTAAADEANGSVEVSNGVTGAVTLAVQFTPVGSAPMTDNGGVTLLGNCGGSSTTSSSSTTVSSTSTTTNSSTSTTTANVAAVVATPRFTG